MALMDFWDSYGTSFVNAVSKKKEIDKYIRQFQDYTTDQLEEIIVQGQYNQAQRTAAEKLLSKNC